MARRLVLPMIALVLLTGQAEAATVSASLSIDSTIVAPESAVPYEIHLTIREPNAAALPLGLCQFVVNLETDLNSPQNPVDTFSPDITGGFATAGLLYGTSDGRGNVSGIGAAQSCLVADDTAIGVGLSGQTLVARGTLQLPAEPGEYRVEIVPVEITLIDPDGGSLRPTSTSGGSVTITVGSVEDDSEPETDNEDSDPGGADPNTDVGTDGPDDATEDDRAGTNGATETPSGADDDASETDSSSDGRPQIGSGANQTEGTAEVATATQPLCGAGLLLPITLGLVVAQGARSVNRNARSAHL